MVAINFSDMSKEIEAGYSIQLRLFHNSVEFCKTYAEYVELSKAQPGSKYLMRPEYEFVAYQEIFAEDHKVEGSRSQNYAKSRGFQLIIDALEKGLSYAEYEEMIEKHNKIFIVNGEEAYQRFGAEGKEKLQSLRKTQFLAQHAVEDSIKPYLEQCRLEAEKAEQQAKEKTIQEERQRFEAALKNWFPSTDRADYIVKRSDYKRGNPLEHEYRKIYLLKLLRVFNCKCANCGKDDDWFDLDHFFLSKNDGGNFIVLHKDGFFVNNAIPLCPHCNRSKGDRLFDEFFTAERLVEIAKLNRKMTDLINLRQRPTNINEPPI